MASNARRRERRERERMTKLYGHLDEWMYSLKHIPERDDNLPKDLHNGWRK